MKGNYKSGSKATKQTNSKAGNKGRRMPKFDREGQQYGREEVAHKYNDVSWYAKNASMLRDAASFSYNSPLGEPVPIFKMLEPGVTSEGTAYNLADQYLGTIPGLMALKFVPCVGRSLNSTSPANLAAQNIYSYVRYMNSGAKNYDQADLMLYLLAMDSIYMMWNWGKRVYGYTRAYSQKNKYMPKAYGVADGIDIYTVQANLADYRMQLNALAAEISSFCVPAVMPLFIRHSWMVSNIYKDSDTDKAQQYMFVPRVYYVYDETGSQYGGQLIAKDATKLNSLAAILNAIKAQLDAIAYSEDIGVMSGDILKAYGQDKLFKITAVEPDYSIEPVYNEEVLNQIHNSSLINVTGAKDQNITQDPNSGYLIYDPTLKAPLVYQTKYFVNMPWNEVTPENTMVGTRLSALLGEPSDDKTTCKLTTCGTEYITERDIYWFKLDGSGDILRSQQFDNYFKCTLSTITDAVRTVPNMIQAMALSTQFDWHPITLLLSETAGQGQLYNILGDVSNYTFIEDWNLQQMHQTAILSEFNVPQIGSF